MFQRVIARIRGLLTRTRAGRELDEELRFHVEMETQANIGRGMEPVAARRGALIDLGGVEQTREAAREVRSVWLDGVCQDVRYAARRLGRERAFAIAAILTIGLTIGLATTIFSVTNAVLLRPLPYRDPERLALVGWSHSNDLPGERPYAIADNEYRYWVERNHVFEGMAGAHFWNVELVAEGLSEPLHGQKITASLLPLLGTQPLVGRTFVPDDELPGRTGVVLLSEGLWRRAFGGDPGVVGRRIRLQENGELAVFDVVGVTPATFRLQYAITPGSYDARTPPGIDIFTPARRNTIEAVSTASYTTFARLRRGITFAQAHAETDALKESYSRELSRRPPGKILTKVVPLHEATFGRTRPALLTLLAAVGLVLLIGCTNVASLLVARGDARRQEMAVRASLGAGRRRLFQQLLTENAALAVCGGSVGLVLSLWGTRMLAGIVPADMPRAGDVGIDVRVLAFSVAVSVIAGLLFGFGPALRASRPNGIDSLRVRGSMTADVAGTRSRHWLVGAEITLVVVLVVAASLMLNSLWRMAGADPGFDSRHLMTLQLKYSRGLASDTERRARFERALVSEVRALTGVTHAGLTSDLPFSSGGVIGFELVRGERPRWAEVFVVDQHYLSLLGLRVVTGRALGPDDARSGHRVAVVNQAVAQRDFPGTNPVGQQLILKDAYEIVGVVASHREMVRSPDDWQNGIRAGMLRKDDNGPVVSALSPPAVYVLSAQSDWTGSLMYLVVRTGPDPRTLVPSLRRTVAELDAGVSIREAATFDEWMGLTSAAPRFYAVVLAVFSLVALALAAVGIYGVLAQSVGQRVHEIGVRMALGAGSRDIAWLVLSRTMAVVAIGEVIGLVTAVTAMRTLRAFLFEVSPADPLTLAVVPTLLLLVAACASYVPTRRATRVDPMTALRRE